LSILAGGTMTKTNQNSLRAQSLLPLFALGFAAACASTGQPTKPGQPGGEPVVHLDMEPIKIEATSDADGIHIDAYDAPELFEHAGKALSEKRYDDAVKVYGKLLKSFPESPYARPALYNLGLAQIGKKDWAAAIDSFKGLIEKYPSHPDAKDSLFQLGACYAEENNWPASAEVFARVLERNDLNADDRIEAIARRGFAQFNLNDLDTAEKTFRAAMVYKQKIESEERLSTDFYLAFSQYHLGQVFHLRFRKAALRLPEAQLDKDLEEKAHLLLTAQRAYIDTIKFGNPAWASAAGFQVGSLYEELFDAFMSVPVPPELDAEARAIYQEELLKKIRILLEKSLRWQRENLLMIERLGVNTEWADKSKLAYAKLLRLLDPKLPGATEDIPADKSPRPAPSKAAPPPPVPQAPFRGGESPKESAPSEGDALRRHVL
jgi:tetratricopeptide (TPR) repeat protein